MSACDFCGYDTSGTAGFCPECGRPVFRFTDRAREVVAGANLRALAEHRRPRNAPWWRTALGVLFEPVPMPACIEPVHILLALVDGPKGVGYHALDRSGAAIMELRARIRAAPDATDAPAQECDRLPLAPNSERLVRAAVDEAAMLGNSWVGTEHLLLALCRFRDRETHRLLRAAGVEYEAVRAFVVANLDALKGEDLEAPR